MAIKHGDRVELIYTGRFKNGDIFDTNKGKAPFCFMVGASQVIEGFDKAVLGMERGEKKEFKVLPKDGYGERRDDLIFEFNREDIGCDEAKEGDPVKLKTIDGGVINARIKTIIDTKVIIDANHHLAGQTLLFNIEIKDFFSG